jgi:hypothetical protein
VVRSFLRMIRVIVVMVAVGFTVVLGHQASLMLLLVNRGLVGFVRIRLLMLFMLLVMSCLVALVKGLESAMQWNREVLHWLFLLNL